jgi:hypothetical protein
MKPVPPTVLPQRKKPVPPPVAEQTKKVSETATAGTSSSKTPGISSVKTRSQAKAGTASTTANDRVGNFKKGEGDISKNLSATTGGVVGGLSETAKGVGSAARKGNVTGVVTGAVKGTGQTVSSTGKGVGGTLSGVGMVRYFVKDESSIVNVCSMPYADA